jgi:hypothetical protein
MVYFQTKNTNLGKFWSALDWQMFFFNFMAIWNNLWTFGIVGGHLVYISHFGMFGPRKIWQP